jgi:putative phosphoesterase
LNAIEAVENKIVGVISDTHNLLRPEALAALAGSDLIIHAGDVCSAQILEELKIIAPIVVVRGNNDTGAWAENIAEAETVKFGEISIFVIHDLKKMLINPAVSGFKVVISGHSHKPSIENRGGILYLNPGSAGRRRFKLPVSVARLKISEKGVKAEIIELPI